MMARIALESLTPGFIGSLVFKYQERAEDFETLSALARNPLGRWGRAGCALDEERWQAAGALSLRGLSDLYGLMMHVPVLRQLARRLNDPLRRRDARMRLALEGAHYDYRYLTALCRRRARVAMQVLVGKEWVDLPIDLTTLTVFPGTIASRAFGLPNVLHRVVHVGDPLDASQPSDVRTDDVTLLIGAA
jgi:hypothetical protein